MRLFPNIEYVETPGRTHDTVNEPPVIIGHYQLIEKPQFLSDNVLCLDILRKQCEPLPCYMLQSGQKRLTGKNILITK